MEVDAVQAVHRLRDLLTVLTSIDEEIATKEITNLNLKSDEKVKKFTKSYVRQKNLFEPLLLGLTAGLKKDTVVRLFAEHWRGLIGRQHFRLKWEEFVMLLKQMSSSDSMGRAKLFECIMTFLNRKAPKIAKMGFKKSGLDGSVGYSTLVVLREVLIGAHDSVSWPVSAR